MVGARARRRPQLAHAPQRRSDCGRVSRIVFLLIVHARAWRGAASLGDAAPRTGCACDDLLWLCVVAARGALFVDRRPGVTFEPACDL